MTDYAPLVQKAFELEPEDGAYALADGAIEGRIPAWVRGTYYLNGPARFRRGDLTYRHWLDGDGMVSTLRFDGDAVRFTNRFVKSRKLVDEETAGHPLYRAFGTAFEGDRLRRGVGLESPVNVSVYPAFGTLLAFGEQGLPWELDLETLETRGEYSFGGKLNAISPFSAHPNQDYTSGELFNFGVSFSAARPCINLYRFDRDGGQVYRRRIPLEWPCSLHDFGISQRFAVFYLNPHILHIEKMMDAGGSVMDALSWESALGSRLLVASRESGEPVAEIAIGSRYCLHHINCFEDGDDLVVDVVELEQPIYDQYTVPELFREVRSAEPVRYVVRPQQSRLIERRTLDHRLMADFPAVDTRCASLPYRHFWMLAISSSERSGRKFFDRIVHLDWHGGEVDSYQAPAKAYFGGEPVLIGHPEESEHGLVICQCFDAERESSEFLLFDSQDVGAGPVARLRLEAPMPLAFHACYQPDAA